MTNKNVFTKNTLKNTVQTNHYEFVSWGFSFFAEWEALFSNTCIGLLQMTFISFISTRTHLSFWN